MPKRTRNERIWLKITIPAVILFLLFWPSLAEPITVRPGDNLSQVVDMATPGDVIEVEGGSYPGNFVIDKPLSLVGIDNGTGLPELDGNGHGSVVYLEADGITIRGFGITGSGNEEDDAGIYISSQGNLVRSCTAFENQGSGIICLNSDRNTLVMNQIVDNGGLGIALNNSNFNLLASNLIARNSKGVSLYGSKNNSLEGNVLSNNYKEGVYLAKSSDSNLITKNEIQDNSKGIYIFTSRGNVITDNNLTLNDYGIYIENHDDSQSITPAVGQEDKGGVYIKYKPTTEVSSYNVSDPNIDEVTSNVIYRNVLENKNNAYDDSSNQWNEDDYGNRYSDFDQSDEGCKDRDRDGICDSAYQINGGRALDEYPVASKEAVSRKYMVTGEDGASIGLEVASFEPLSDIKLSYTVPSDFSGFVAMFESTKPHRSMTENELSLSSVSYKAVEGNIAGETHFQAPAREGEYDLRLFESDGKEISSLTFDVLVPKVEVDVAQLKTCDSFNVTFEGAPGSDNDWIGMFNVASSDLDPVMRKYLDGTRNGSLTFYAPAATGTYDLRLIPNDGTKSVAKSGQIEVEQSAGVRIVASPSRVSGGQKIYVSFWGAKRNSVIGMYGMTRPDRYHVSKKSTGGQQCGVIEFTAPRSPGTYDFRLFEDDVYRKHLGASNVVTVT